jgi:protein required for attachment to host cells
MSAETEESLVVVFDGAGARFFRRAPNGRLTLINEVESGLHRKTSDIVSDRQGRTFASAGGGIRSPYEPQHDPRKMERHNFVHRLVEELDDSYDRNQFKYLIVVAPERSLGEFRSLAPEKLRRAVWREVPKGFTNLTVHELEARLKSHLEPEGETAEPPRRP